MSRQARRRRPLLYSRRDGQPYIQLLASAEAAAAAAVDTGVAVAAEDESAIVVVASTGRPRLIIRAEPPSTSQLA